MPSEPTDSTIADLAGVIPEDTLNAQKTDILEKLRAQRDKMTEHFSSRTTLLEAKDKKVIEVVIKAGEDPEEREKKRAQSLMQLKSAKISEKRVQEGIDDFRQRKQAFAEKLVREKLEKEESYRNAGKIDKGGDLDDPGDFEVRLKQEKKFREKELTRLNEIEEKEELYKENEKSLNEYEGMFDGLKLRKYQFAK